MPVWRKFAQVLRGAPDHQPGQEHRDDREHQQAVEPGADAAEQADFVLHNVAATLEGGGMGWDAVRQGRLFLSDMSGLPALRERWSSQFGGPARPLHPIQYAVAPSLLVMLEVIAAV